MAKTPTSVILCTICQEDDVSKNASTWCFECDDFLCFDCSRVHSRSKSTKAHKVTTIEDYQNFPQFVLDIKNRCFDHDEKYDFHCSFHGIPCCTKCIKELHKECREFVPIRDVIENIKTSAALSQLDETLEKLKENFDEVARYLTSRRNKNRTQRSEILNEIKLIRSKVNDHFDKIEHEIEDELESYKKCIDIKLEIISNQIEDKKHGIVTIRQDFSTMKRHTTELQTYLGLKQIESTTKREADFLANLIDNESSMNETNMVMEVVQALKTLVHDTASFGRIVVCSSKSKDMKVLRERTAQLLVQTQKTIHELKVSKKSTIEVQGEKIYGCIILPDGKMAFADYNSNSLQLYKREGDFIGQTQLPGKPGSCAYVRNNQVAVTLPCIKKIWFVDVEEGKIVKEIEVEGDCWGIHVENENLFVRLNDCNAVLVLDLDGDANITQSVTISGRYLLDISIFSGMIYCSNWNENTVYCYTMEGKLMWTFKHDDLLEPRGIALDKTGFIYVACNKSNKLMVISPDGKEGKVLLDEKDGLESPEALHINRELSLLLIASKQKTLLCYI